MGTERNGRVPRLRPGATSKAVPRLLLAVSGRRQLLPAVQLALEPEGGLQSLVALRGRQPGQPEQVLGGAEQAQVVEVVSGLRTWHGVWGHHNRGDTARRVGRRTGVSGVPAGLTVYFVRACALVPGDL